MWKPATRALTLFGCSVVLALGGLTPAQAMPPSGGGVGGHLMVAPRFPALGDTVVVMGRIANPSALKRPILVQRRVGSRWVTVDRGQTKKLIFGNFWARTLGPMTIRVLAPRTRIKGRWLPETMTPTRKLRVVRAGQSGITGLPDRVPPSVSVDGRFEASVDGQVAKLEDIPAGTVQRVTLPESCEAISVPSDDGRYAATTCGTMFAQGSIFLVDFVERTVKKLGVPSSFAAPVGAGPVVSGDGSVVAWVEADQTSGDLPLGQLMTLAPSTGERQAVTAPAAVLAASVSVTADGRYLCFSTHKALDPTDTDRLPEPYLLDRTTGTFTRLLAGVGVSGPVKGISMEASLSRDGRYLAFSSNAVGLTADKDLTRNYDIYLLDRTTKRVTRVTNGNADSNFPQISADSTKVTFTSSATNLVKAGDRQGQPRPYLWYAWKLPAPTA